MKRKPCNESKAERFKRIAEVRVNKIIAMIRLLGQCSTPSNYEFTDSQVNYIFSALQAELDKAKKCFFCRATRGKERFTLSSNHQPEIKSDPTIVVALSDGTYLRAVSMYDNDYPAIKIYWDRNDPEDIGEICFVEHNTHSNGKSKVFVCVYSPEQDEPIYYEPYSAKSNEDSKGEA